MEQGFICIQESFWPARASQAAATGTEQAAAHCQATSPGGHGLLPHPALHPTASAFGTHSADGAAPQGITLERLHRLMVLAV